MKKKLIPSWMHPFIFSAILFLAILFYDSVTVFSILACAVIASMGVIRVVHLIQKKGDYVLPRHLQFEALIRLVFPLVTFLLLLANYFFCHTDPMNLMLGGVGTAMAILYIAVILFAKGQKQKKE